MAPMRPAGSTYRTPGIIDPATGEEVYPKDPEETTPTQGNPDQSQSPPPSQSVEPVQGDPNNPSPTTKPEPTSKPTSKPTSTDKPKRQDKVVVAKDVEGEYRWTRYAPNGEAISDSSEGYTGRGHALTAAKRSNADVDPETIKVDDEAESKQDDPTPTKGSRK